MAPNPMATLRSVVLSNLHPYSTPKPTCSHQCHRLQVLCILPVRHPPSCCHKSLHCCFMVHCVSVQADTQCCRLGLLVLQPEGHDARHVGGCKGGTCSSNNRRSRSYQQCSSSSRHLSRQTGHNQQVSHAPPAEAATKQLISHQQQRDSGLCHCCAAAADLFMPGHETNTTYHVSCAPDALSLLPSMVRTGTSPPGAAMCGKRSKVGFCSMQQQQQRGFERCLTAPVYQTVKSINLCGPHPTVLQPAAARF